MAHEFEVEDMGDGRMARKLPPGTAINIETGALTHPADLPPGDPKRQWWDRHGNEKAEHWEPPQSDPSVFQIEVEARLARIETKQDALYAEIHTVRLTVDRIDENFAKLVEGVMGAMTSNPLLRRLLGGGK